MISIIIPLYNKADNVAKTLESVFAQTYQDFEIVIVDDGSTDNSLTIVQSFNDPRIRIITQENSGVSAARNRGIAEAKYELIAFLDADDEWLPEHLKQIIQLERNFSECSVFASNYKIVDSDAMQRYPVNTQVVLHDQDSGIIQNYFASATRTAPPLWTSAIAVRKNAIEDIGGFPIGVTLGEDLLVWAKLACQYKIAYSKKITAIYHFRTLTELLTPRRPPDSLDVVGTELNALARVYENKYLNKYVALWHKMRLMTYVRLNDRTNALKELLKMPKHSRWNFHNLLFFGLILMPKIIRNKLLLIRANRQNGSQ